MEDESERDRRLASTMRLAETLRPQDFQPWNDDRPHGRTLEEALHAFVPFGSRGMVSHYLARIDAGIEPAAGIARMREWLWHMLRSQLSAGGLVADATRIDELEVRQISTRLFQESQPDFRANRLTTAGITFCGVMISDVQAGGDALAGAPASIGTDAVLMHWLTDYKTKNPRAKRDDVIRDCAAANHTTSRVVRATWAKLPAGLRRPIGKK